MARLVGKLNGRYKTGLAGSNGLYSSWQNMKQRCLNPNHPKYPRYGGRGIRICPEWMDISGFVEWARASGYQSGLTIDRKNNDGDYSPENCCWVTAHDNSRRKGTTKITFAQGQEIRRRLEAGEDENALADEFGVVHGTIWFIKNRFTHVPDGECTTALTARDAVKCAG